MKFAHRYLQALKEDFNLIGMSSAFALSAATGTPIPLLVGLVAEAAYLIFVPDSSWYDRRLSRRYDAEVLARRSKLKDEIWPRLRPDTRTVFERLETIRGEMDLPSSEGKKWLRELLRKLDYLLEKYLLFADKEIEFRRHLLEQLDEIQGGHGSLPVELTRDMETARAYLSRAAERKKGKHGADPRESTAVPDPAESWVRRVASALREHYDTEITGLNQAKEQEAEVPTQAVIAKRTEVLERRKEFVGKMEKALVNLNHQMQLLEDTFGLIRDEIRARSPEQILADIEDVVGQTDTMTQVLEEVAPYEQMMERMKV